jgi:hypothetical protein
MTKMAWWNVAVTSNTAVLTLTNPIVVQNNFVPQTSGITFTSNNVQLSQSGSIITITPQNMGFLIG